MLLRLVTNDETGESFYRDAFTGETIPIRFDNLDEVVNQLKWSNEMLRRQLLTAKKRLSKYEDISDL